jgi:hypothetical protein
MYHEHDECGCSNVTHVISASTSAPQHDSAAPCMLQTHVVLFPPLYILWHVCT